MRPDRITLLLFVLYCVEIGLFLIFAPWTPLWNRTLALVPLEPLRALALHPAARAGVTGFGFVHLIWGLHDLSLLLARRSP